LSDRSTASGSTGPGTTASTPPRHNLGRTYSVSLLGIHGALVEIEADITSNLPAFVLIGLPDTALNEAKDRVRSAATNSGIPLPNRKITVNLSPAALPKHGSGFDLAIAVAALAASGTIDPSAIDGVVHLGELGLDGRTRPIDGILPAVLAAQRAGFDAVMVPAGNADEAALVPGIRIIGVASLRDAAIAHGTDLDPEPVEVILRSAPDDADPGRLAADRLDLADVIGNADAVDAMIVAAAGGHHVFLLGPPGAGKTMLASRLPGLLPELDPHDALEVSSVRSLSGLPVGSSLTTRPPFEAPHHTASAAALVGGGSGIIRPGAAARAAHGVLFLDEAPEFAPSVLDALRQPLESGVITIHRSNAVAQYPGRFQLVLAANPCPCGQYGAQDGNCTCPPQARRRYVGRLSGPLLDRIDIQYRVARITSAQLRMGSSTLTTRNARARVIAAREAASARLASTPWRLNSQVPGSWLRSPAARLAPAVTASIDRALERGGITMRGYDRVLRLAWTVADLDGAARPDADHVGKALFLRRAIST
jgi:magnesium chelatase family protein